MLPRASVLTGVQLEAGHRDAGGVRAVRRVGDDDLAPLLELTAVAAN